MAVVLSVTILPIAHYLLIYYDEGGGGFKEPTRILTRVKKEFLSPIIHKKTRCLAGDGTVAVGVWSMDETDRAGPA